MHRLTLHPDGLTTYAATTSTLSATLTTATTHLTAAAPTYSPPPSVR